MTWLDNAIGWLLAQRRAIGGAGEETRPSEIWAEVRSCSWPPWPELVRLSVMCVCTIAAAAILIHLYESRRQ